MQYGQLSSPRLDSLSVSFGTRGPGQDQNQGCDVFTKEEEQKKEGGLEDQMPQNVNAAES